MLKDNIIWDGAPTVENDRIFKLAIMLALDYKDTSSTALILTEYGCSMVSSFFAWYCMKYGGKAQVLAYTEDDIKATEVLSKNYDGVIDYIDLSESSAKSYDVGNVLCCIDGMREQIQFSSDGSTTIIIIDADTAEGLTSDNVIKTEAISGNISILSHKAVGSIYDISHAFTPNSIYMMEQYDVEDSIRLDITDYEDVTKTITLRNLFFSYLPSKELLPMIEGKVKVLDLGCNAGYNTKELENIYGYAEGVDINPKLITAAIISGVNCKLMDMKDLRYDEGFFSMVVAKDVLEHSDDPRKTIKEVYRVLANNGNFSALIPLDGEPFGVDDLTTHQLFMFGNRSHIWKATAYGVLSYFFEAGFTDVGIQLYSYKQLFGEERLLGDRMVLVSGIKKKDVVRLPFKYLDPQMSWSIFLTLSCNSDCSYCIQRIVPDEFREANKYYNKNMLSWGDWGKFLTNVQTTRNRRLGLIGGEPTIYPGFMDLLNTCTKRFIVTATSNLKTSMFDDPVKFADSIDNKNQFRLNVSFHPSLVDVDEFCSKVLSLRNNGVYVDQVAMVDLFGSNFSYYYNEFIKRGVTLQPQTYLGKYNDQLYPTGEDVSYDYGEHCVDNFDLYREGFSAIEKKEVLCKVDKFLIAPSGDVHKCHYHLYANRSPLFNIMSDTPTSVTDYSNCSDFGFCNPCDFPQSSFRNTEVNLLELFRMIIKNEALANTLMSDTLSFVSESPDFSKLINMVVEKLYASSNPWWVLYNDAELIRELNDYIGGGRLIDNENAAYLARYDLTLFRGVPGGINLFRLLDDVSLIKYVAATAAVYSALVDSNSALVTLYGGNIRTAHHIFAKLLSIFTARTPLVGGDDDG